MRSAPVEVPTLEQLAADPGKALRLPRPVLVSLATRALTAHAALLTALVAAPVEPARVEEDRLVGGKEIAALMGVSLAFVMQHRDEWPFVLKRAGMRPLYSLNGYRAWVAEQDGRAVPSARAAAQRGA